LAGCLVSVSGHRQTRDSMCRRLQRIASMMGRDAHVAVRISSTFLNPAVCLLLSAASLLASDIRPSRASVIINATQQGSDVIFSFSGSVDTSVFGTPGGASYYPGFYGNIYSGGFLSATSAPFAIYATDVNFSSFQPTGYNTANSSSGSVFGLGQGMMGGEISLSNGYISGTALAGTMTYTNKTFSSLGLTDGAVYSGSFGSGQVVTMNIGTASVSAAPAPLPILGLPAVLFYSRKLKKRIKESRETSSNALI